MKTKFSLAIVLVAVILLLAAGAAYAGTTGYTLAWWTVDGGGGRTAAPAYTLLGAAGQPDAASLSGGGYSLRGGFWGSAPADRIVYLPFVRR